MRTSSLLVATAFALLLVFPSCTARPSDIKASRSQESTTFAASDSSSSEEEVIAGNGEYKKRSKEDSNKAVAQSAQKSSESYEADDDGSYVKSKKSQSSKSAAVATSSSQNEEEIKLNKKSCGCHHKKNKHHAPAKRSHGKSCKKELSEEEIKKEYCQKKDESLEAYFKRIVAKTSYTSTTESYIKILNIVRKDFAFLDLWYDTKYIDLIEKYYKALYLKQSSESEEEYYSRIIKKDSWESEEQYAKRVIIIRDLFPTLSLWTSEKLFEKYTKSLYSVIYKKWEKESEEEYVKRIFTKDSFFDKSDEIWAKRVFLIQEATISNSIWYKEDYFQYTKSFYEFYYKKVEKESSEAWLKRALKPLPGESFDNAIKRIRLIKKATESFGFWKADYFRKVEAKKCFESDYLAKIQKAFFEESSYVKTQKSQKSSTSAAAESSSSTRELQSDSESGEYKEKSHKTSAKAVASASQSSSESYEAKSTKSSKKELTEEDIKKEYCQKKGESLEAYFKRIVAKTSYTSTTESYIKTLNIVRKDFANLDLWYDVKYIDFVKDYYKAVYVKQSSESEEEYYSRIIKKDSWESEEQYAKRVVVIRDLFPTLSLWTSEKLFEKYTKSLYSVIYKKWEKESEEEYVKRIFTKDSLFDKSDDIWAKRLFLAQEATISSSIWYKEDYFKYTKSFYKFYYKKAEKESAEAWLTRALKPLSGESTENAIKRIRLIKKATESFGFWSVDYFKKVENTKCFQSDYFDLIQKEFFELTEEDIKKEYVQKKGESLETYFKRIVAKTSFTSTTESYIKTLNIVRKDFANLDLWYDVKYIDFVKDYYKALYVKQASESDEVYYSRIIKKESWESEEQYAKRVVVVRDLFPTLPLWTKEELFEKYTKSLYSTIYKKWEKESEKDYVKRIFAKDSLFDKSDDVWAKRLFLIQEATYTNSIWYKEDYFQYTKSFYEFYYKKTEKESGEAWLTRALKPLSGESFDNAIKRIRLIKKATESFGFWKVDYFKKVEATKCFQSDYLKNIQKEFFELTEEDIKKEYIQKKGESLETYFKRIVAKTSYTSTTESYIKTLNIVRKDFANLDLWYDVKYIDFVKDYYKALYVKQASESDEVYYSRIIKKESWESEEQYAKRVVVVRDLFPTLPLWTKEELFEKYTKSLYATIYKKWEKESEEEYVKRIFAKDSLFDKSDDIWVKKLFLIQEATISSSIWYKEDYFKYTKSFYEFYYKKVEKESSEAWLTRALKPLPEESFDNAIKRIRLIRKATENSGFWKFEYFKKIEAAKSFQSDYLINIQKEFFELTEEDIKKEYCQKKGESLDVYFKRIVAKTSYTSTTESYIKTLNIVRKDFANLDLWYDVKYIDFVKDYYKAVYVKQSSESEEEYYSRIIKKDSWESEEQYAKRVVVIRDLFPTLSLWTSEKLFEKYTKSLYSVIYKKWEKESEEEYVKRIFTKDSLFDKSDDIWAKRLFLAQEATISSSIWYKEDYFKYTKSFYEFYYKKVEKESSEAWLTRALKPLPGESFDNAIKRIRLIKKATESFGFWNFEYFKKIETVKSFQSDYLAKVQKEFFELTEEDIKKEYCQKKGESLETYFKRIVSKTAYTSTTESYIKVLSIVRKDFANLDLWYDVKYIDFVKDYYKALYIKQASESDEVYYSRIIKKESWESEEQYAKRVVVIRDLFPTLPLWTKEELFEKYTKSLYATIYKKWEKESEEEYVKRIFTKDSFFDKSDEIWAKRVFLIQEATISNSIWYKEDYFQYTKSFYEFYYKKVEKESGEAWLTRALKPLPGESFDSAIKRIYLIKKATESFGFWKAEYFKKVEASKCFESEYIVKIKKEFFTTEEYYSSQKSQTSSESSSVASSSTEQEVSLNSETGQYEAKSESSNAAARSASSSESQEAVLVRRGA